MKITVTIYNLVLFALILLAANFAVFSQTTVKVPAPKPISKPAPAAKKSPPEPPAPPIVYTENETNEKSLKVSSKVFVKLCVLEANVKINGWDRNEIRVFVKDGSKLGFKVLQANAQNEPVWIMVLGFDRTGKAVNSSSECLYGDEVEIDLPRNASVELKGQETRTEIDSVRKAVVKNIGGNITLRNISEGVEAATYEGDVRVENSSGAMMLDSSDGNIIAFEVSPSDIGDIFKAKTNNGRIVLQDLAHRQIEVNSISGAINFNGAFANGGIYNFGTSNGSINLAIPTNSSCKVVATYGYGGFNSELPIKKETENNLPRVQRIVGTMGTGEATLNLTTSSGAIRIKSRK